METTEIIRILRQCGVCGLSDCSECPEYTEPEEEGYGFMWSCGGVLLDAADRLEELSQIKSGDLISRSALLAKVEWEESYMGTNGTEYVLAKDIREAPSVEAEPVVHAHWNGDCCSRCGELAEENYPRCPYCGAHMDEGVAYGT